LFERLFAEGLQIDDFIHTRPSRGLISTVAIPPPMEEKRRTNLKQNAILADRRQASIGSDPPAPDDGPIVEARPTSLSALHALAVSESIRSSFALRMPRGLANLT
jgi:hypothetical protein